MKTYGSIWDIGQREVRDALMGDDAFAALDPEPQAAALDRVVSLMQARGLIIWDDGWSEARGACWLPAQGFRLNLDEALEGADFWDAVADGLAND